MPVKGPLQPCSRMTAGNGPLPAGNRRTPGMGPGGIRGGRTRMGAAGGIAPLLEAGVTTAGSPARAAATRGGGIGGIATARVMGEGPDAGESKGGSAGNDAVAKNGSARLPVNTDQGDQYPYADSSTPIASNARTIVAPAPRGADCRNGAATGVGLATL